MDQKHSGECDIIAYGDSITFVMDQVQENRESVLNQIEARNTPATGIVPAAGKLN